FFLFYRLSTLPPLLSTLFPYTTLFRSSSFSVLSSSSRAASHSWRVPVTCFVIALRSFLPVCGLPGSSTQSLDLLGKDAGEDQGTDRKSTRLNSSHRTISYAVFCLKKKK